jgi:glycosyltransferase involved in cell wall biosynthesis
VVKSLWITWEYQARNRSLSRWFEAELLEIVVPGRRLPRYVTSIRRTVRALRKRRPALLFVQSPSIVLALLSVTVGRLWTSRVIVDAHNGGIFPLEGRSRALNLVYWLILRQADVVLVSNAELKNALAMPQVEVLPDPLPYDIHDSPHGHPDVRQDTPRPLKVTYITSWAADEPYHEVIEAARLLLDGFIVQATGRPPTELPRKNLPQNFRLLGFLSDVDYHAELCRSDVLLVLTNRPSCLTCGAYEAIALEKPLILSSSTALEDYFGDGAIYTKNRASAIRDAVARSGVEIEVMRERAAMWRGRLHQKWLRTFPKIRARVEADAFDARN